eukprot:458228_1
MMTLKSFIWILLFVEFINTTLCQLIQHATLNTTNTNDNGAVLTILRNVDVTVDNTNHSFNILCSGQINYHLGIDLDNSWSFDPSKISTFTFTLHSSTPITAADLDIITTFSVNNNKWITVFLSPDTTELGKTIIAPVSTFCDNSSTPTQLLGVGNIKQCVDESICTINSCHTNCATRQSKVMMDVSGVGDTKVFMDPTTLIYSTAEWPLTVTLINDPINNYFFVRTTNPGWDQFNISYAQCGFGDQFDTSNGLQIYIGLDDPGEYVSFTGFDLAYSTQPYPTASPTKIPTKSPIYNQNCPGSSWIQCATESGWCTINGISEGYMSYGESGKFNLIPFSAANSTISISCNWRNGAISVSTHYCCYIAGIINFKTYNYNQTVPYFQNISFPELIISGARYGLSGRYVYRAFERSIIHCHLNYFADPYATKVKVCDYTFTNVIPNGQGTDLEWVDCGEENGLCNTFTDQQIWVRYGINNKYNYRYIQSYDGTIPCDDILFNNPDPTEIINFKKCQYMKYSVSVSTAFFRLKSVMWGCYLALGIHDIAFDDSGYDKNIEYNAFWDCDNHGNMWYLMDNTMGSETTWTVQKLYSQRGGLAVNYVEDVGHAISVNEYNAKIPNQTANTIYFTITNTTTPIEYGLYTTIENKACGLEWSADAIYDKWTMNEIIQPGVSGKEAKFDCGTNSADPFTIEYVEAELFEFGIQIASNPIYGGPESSLPVTVTLVWEYAIYSCDLVPNTRGMWFFCDISNAYYYRDCYSSPQYKMYIESDHGNAFWIAATKVVLNFNGTLWEYKWTKFCSNITFQNPQPSNQTCSKYEGYQKDDICIDGNVDGNCTNSQLLQITLSYPLVDEAMVEPLNNSIKLLSDVCDATNSTYSIIQREIAWANMDTECLTVFGTHAASINSRGDFETAYALCQLYGYGASKICGVGGSDAQTGFWTFYDGSGIWASTPEYDSGGLWATGEPSDGFGEDYACIVGSMSKGIHDCGIGSPVAYPLCNNPISWQPTLSPSHIPSTTPSESPTKTPSQLPTKSPTKTPSNSPTKTPSHFPTKTPSKSPTKTPSKSPTKTPIKDPTQSPTKYPTQLPTKTPSKNPTQFPTKNPTKYPSIYPTKYPTKQPSNLPTKSPTNQPTKSPTKYPTPKPTISPTIEERNGGVNEETT